MPGGSSSGSGAAVAAGLTVGALGTDTGGSIRLPAAFSGIAGLKPTYGRISRAGILPLSWTLDHAGPMARTVEDCAYLLQALAGHDPADPTSSRAPVPDYVAALTRDVRGLRIGVPRAYFLADLDPDMAAAFDRALAVLGQLGATVRPVEIPSIETTSAGLLILLTEAFAYHEPNLRATPERYGDVLREKLLAGALFTGAEYVQAQRLRRRLCAEIDEVFTTVDVLATPTTRGPATAFTVVLDPTFGFPRYNTLPFNLTGQPALAVPCGFSRTGLPLSLQLAGRAFEEATVLQVGHAYQTATEWHGRHPAL